MEEFGGFLLGAIFFASVATVLVLYILSRHKERMALIEKGTSVADLKGVQGDALSKRYLLASLKWGLLAGGVGIGLIVANFLDQWYHMEESVYFASMLIFGGIALVIFYVVASRKLRSE